MSKVIEKQLVEKVKWTIYICPHCGTEYRHSRAEAEHCERSCKTKAEVKNLASALLVLLGKDLVSDSNFLRVNRDMSGQIGPIVSYLMLKEKDKYEWFFIYPIQGKFSLREELGVTQDKILVEFKLMFYRKYAKEIDVWCEQNA